MKNGIHFRTPESNSETANDLVLVESSEAGEEDAADDFQAPERDLNSLSLESVPPHTTIVVLASVSLACVVIAIATSSYAAWLSRQYAARQALTDVNDILKSCQKRMQQLEADIQRLPRF